MATLTVENLERYLQSVMGQPAKILRIAPLGTVDSGTGDERKEYGYGRPLEIHYQIGSELHKAVFHTVKPGPFGHEEMPDRASDMLRAHHDFNQLPGHVRSTDVGAFQSDGQLTSLGNADEFFTIVQYAEGQGYFEDLARIRDENRLDGLDIQRADALCDYLVRIHKISGPPGSLYARRIRELLGHGECVMGLADSYPPCEEPDSATPQFLEWVEHQCVTWRWRIKHRMHRLRQVHGDFHPWNILFRAGADFSLLDRSRGAFGDPADDVTCLTMNYFFFGLQCGGNARFEGPFKELFDRFWQRYLQQTGDREILEVSAPFLAWRGLVLASPVWYPTLDAAIRHKLVKFIRRVLEAPAFDPQRAGEYCEE